MSLRVGIVGLPNVGKSTLFNALTKQRAPAANFPFTTVDPNVGMVTVPDERLDALARMSRSARVVPTTVEFVDIAGLVAGAHKGEGLGNQFLAHIREVDAIAHVVRFFPDPNVVHVSGAPDPVRDVEVVHTELALADLQTVEKVLDRAARDARGGDATAVARAAALAQWQEALASGTPAHAVALTPTEQKAVADLRLLTQKPILYVANLDEQQIRRSAEIVRPFAARRITQNPELTTHRVVPLCVKIEQELGELPEADRKTFLAEYGLEHSGLDDLIRAAYEVLGLITYLTTGEKETRAWTVRRGAHAPEAAGVIHSDFERGFIRAETINWKTLVDAGSYAAARERGLLRDEGKEYVVQDGDVCIFKTAP